jgi:hypothetical protein
MTEFTTEFELRSRNQGEDAGFLGAAELKCPVVCLADSEKL